MPLKKRICKTEQGMNSMIAGSANDVRIMRLISEHSPTLLELLKLSHLSRQMLWKILTRLEKSGWIFKDTVKADESKDVERVNKVVYKVAFSRLDEFARQFVLLRNEIPNLPMSDGFRKKLEKQLDALASLWSAYLKEYKEWAKDAEEAMEDD